MPTQTLVQYPHHLDLLKGLVRQHRELKDEPLLLAIYYRPRREAGDVFLFEVIEGFGSNSVNTEGDFFEATFAATSGLDLEKDQRLHLILTNPEELKYAHQRGWPLMEELTQAIFWDEAFKVLYASQKGRVLLSMISTPRPGLRG